MYLLKIIWKVLSFPFIILAAIATASANPSIPVGPFARNGSNSNSNYSAYLEDEQWDNSHFYRNECHDHDDD